MPEPTQSHHQSIEFVDDIVPELHHHHHSTSSSTSQSSSSHHRHHSHSGAGSFYQGSVSRSSAADRLARRMTHFAIFVAVLVGVGSVAVLFWTRNKNLNRSLANYEGTNYVLASQVSKLEAEKKELLIELEKLQNENKELREINDILRKAVEAK